MLSLAGCADDSPPGIPPVHEVDLPRFMGDWYVIAHIPTRLERHAYDAVESYVLDPDGRVATTFRYRNNSFTAPVKTLKPIATVRAGTGNAVWGMQFIWPIKAEYVVVYLDEDYSQTIIGRSARDYVWIMARTPTISAADYAAHLRRLAQLGYDVQRVRRVPQGGDPSATPQAAIGRTDSAPASR
ncbi:MAG: lipocalin family protein [Sinobacteraceae bacterium]|nr:lipocalin family protein [Nevskiaceae bacterium]